MRKLFGIFNRAGKRAQESDWGRRYGWLVEKDGAVVGELEYVRWVNETQFWHEYRASGRDEKSAPKDPDDWLAMRLVLRNRHYRDVVIESYLAARLPDSSLVSIRGAFVPEEKFR